jgi:hypothetical protein
VVHQSKESFGIENAQVAVLLDLSSPDFSREGYYRVWAEESKLNDIAGVFLSAFIADHLKAPVAST